MTKPNKHWSFYIDHTFPCKEGIEFAKEHKTVAAAWSKCENPGVIMWPWIMISLFDKNIEKDIIWLADKLWMDEKDIAYIKGWFLGFATQRQQYYYNEAVLEVAEQFRYIPSRSEKVDKIRELFRAPTLAELEWAHKQFNKLPID